jgi:hypothetical protein
MGSPPFTAPGSQISVRASREQSCSFTVSNLLQAWTAPALGDHTPSTMLICIFLFYLIACREHEHARGALLPGLPARVCALGRVATILPAPFLPQEEAPVMAPVCLGI